MRKIVNPKTLKGQDKVNRMLDLMGKMTTLNESKSFSELELIKKGPNGIVYGIVRENHDYFIKTSNKPYGKFLSEDFQYVGGLQNKSTEKYHSYAEALKHLNIKFDMLNESYGIENNTNIFESDGNAVTGSAGYGFVLEKEEEIILDDDIKEQKKVLKVDTPKSETPEAPVEDDVADDEFGFSDDEPTDDTDTDTDAFADETDTDTEDTDTTGDEGTEDLGDDEITKKIQKLTGKIGQMLRDSEDVDPKLEKYVINSIISALHLDEMDESDKEDIISKFEGEDDEDSLGGTEDDDFGTEEGGDEDTKTPEEGGDEDTKTPEEGGDELSESRRVVFSKKQLLESFLTKSTKNSIKKVLKERKEICNECGGYKGGNMIEGMMCECSQMYEGNNDGFTDGRKKIDVAKPYGKITADDFSKLRGMKRKRHIDEDEMGVMDALQTGQGYLSATGDLDRDFDGIPNRLDLDNNSDGELDFSMNNRNSFDDNFIELDIDFLRSNAPVKDPGIKRPITKPGTGTDWDRVKRPQVDPKPKAFGDQDDMDYFKSNSPVKEPGIKTPTTKPGTGTDWDKIKRPKADPKPKAMGDEERIRPSYRRRGMFR
jgi:hypothetical protein